ncbi:hypothetical protein PN499_26445 [Kamptonema animale CS-326]|jgi:hypothetical protein|uniref:hypothetical protein n=1 Tax=Kamptonema animale TaxID=92934 RepID=UPI00232D1EAB|nr:hypothetical protein [Kamptonema animale]MDB9514748.1 hypothetical protein [Kamptonema animale CS-326]
MPNIIEGIQNRANRIIDAAKNTSVDIDINPFNDSKIGATVRSGRNALNIGIGVDAGQGAGEADKLGQIGIEANISRDGVGSVGIGVGIGGKSGLLPDPEINIKNAEGRAIITSSLETLAIESGQSLLEGGVAAIKSDLEAIRLRKILAEMEANSRQGQSRTKQTPQNNSQKTPQNTSQQKPQNNSQRTPQNTGQQKPQNNSQRTPQLPSAQGRTIPQFGTPQQTIAPTGRIPSELTPRREATQQPFTIPTDIPKTNTRLPRKPQIGGNTTQQNSGTNQRNGGITLGNAPRQNSSPSQRNGGISFGGNGAPQQDSRVNQRNSGRTIVSPEELEDISANNPNNKPRIVQPQQNSEPRSAYRLLSAREKQLFDCIQNGGGDACNKKYGESAQPSSNNNNDEGFSLSLGDPYIGMGIQE